MAALSVAKLKMEFNKTIIPFALVGYETAYSQLGAARLVGYLPPHIQRALMESLLSRSLNNSGQTP